MSYFTETIAEIETPLYDEINDFFEDAYESSIQKRMVLLLGAVFLVIITFGFIVIKNNSNIISTDSVTNSVSTLVQETTGESNDNLNNAPAAAQGIATFFTPEIQYWAADIVRWSQEHDLDPNAVATIMQIESCGDPSAISGAGAQGLFQVMPFHFGNNENMQDPDTNARRGLNFLNEQLRFTGGDMALSFAGYNGGYAASGGAYANWASETQSYYQWATGIYADAQAGASSSSTLNAWLEAGGGAGCQRAAGNLGL